MPNQRLSKSLQSSAALIVGTLIFMSPSESKLDAAWQAGVARQVITPTEPMWMAGYASRTQPASGTLTDLWAKALVLQDDRGQQAVLISLDLIGIDRELSKSICQKLDQRFGLRRDQIAICCSHTHTGPVVARNLRPMHYELLNENQQRKTDRYASRLEQVIVDLVGQALTDRVDADVSWSVGQATFAVNRRNNPERDVARLRKERGLAGPVDHAVPVLSVRADDRQKAIVFGYACHATVLSSYEWSGDYPGFAQIAIEAAIPDCTAMFWAGCGADQNPLPRRSVQLAKDYGQQLAKSVLETLRGPMSALSGQLTTSYQEIDLDLDQLPTRRELQDDAASKDRFVAARARMLLKTIDGGKSLPQTYPYPVGHWRLGDDVTFVLLGGEVVVDFALKTKTRFPEAWVAGYTNDVMAYIPSKRVWLEGGYEGAGAMVYYGLPTRWHSSVEDRITNEIKRQLDASKRPELP